MYERGDPVLSQQLKRLRNESKISQKDLAKKLYVSQQAVAKWENGSATPNPETLVRLASIFKVSTDELLGNNEKKSAPISEGRQERNIIKIAGRDGTFVERELTDEQILLMKSMLDQLKPIDSENI